MKSYRLTLVSFVVVAALVIYSAWDYKRSKTVEEAKNQDLNIVKLKSDEITHIELNSKNSHLVLEKTAGQWKMLEPLKDSADGPSVTSLLGAVSAEKAKETVVEGPNIQWSVYGLDKPVTFMKISGPSSKPETIQIGAVKAYDGSLYVRINDENRVLLASTVWDMQLSRAAKDYRDKRLLRVDPATEFNSIEIHRTGLDPVLLSKAGDKWQFTDQPAKAADKGNSLPVSDLAVRSFIEQAKALRAADFLDAEKTSKEALKKNGLTHPLLTVKLGVKDKPPLEVGFAAPKNEEPNVNAMSSDLEPLVTVFKTAVDSLNKKREDFFEKTTPFQFKVADVGQIKIATKAVGSMPAVKLDLIKDEKDKTKWTFADTTATKDLDSSKVDELIGKLGHYEVYQYLPRTAAQKADKSGGKMDSKIALLSASGQPLLDFSWGDLVVPKKADSAASSAKDKKSGAKSGAHESGADYGTASDMSYYPAMTNLTDWHFELTEQNLTGLELGDLAKEKTVVKPPSPGATAPGTSQKK